MYHMLARAESRRYVTNYYYARMQNGPQVKMAQPVVITAKPNRKVVSGKNYAHIFWEFLMLSMANSYARIVSCFSPLGLLIVGDNRDSRNTLPCSGLPRPANQSLNALRDWWFYSLKWRMARTEISSGQIIQIYDLTWHSSHILSMGHITM